jgi:hypothetical protein
MVEFQQLSMLKLTSFSLFIKYFFHTLYLLTFIAFALNSELSAMLGVNPLSQNAKESAHWKYRYEDL